MSIRPMTLGALVALALTPLSSAQQLSTIEDGYRLASLTRLDAACGTGLVTDGFADGRFVAYDGQNVELRSASGVLLGRFASFPAPAFASFVVLSPDEQTILYGESSFGRVWSQSVAGGGPVLQATLPFNFDAAFDPADPTRAYVSAATASFGTNSVHLVDLLAQTAVEVARVPGFSGPIATDSNGDVLLGVLPSSFPFPADETEIVRFPAVLLDGSALRTEADAASVVPGLDGTSSIDFDLFSEQLFVAETNTGASGGSTIFRVHRPDGALLGVVAEADVFAGSVETVNAGAGTVFGPYQAPLASMRYTASDCFGAGIIERVEVIGARPRGTWSGPSIGNSGNATFRVEGAIPGGFVSLWLARTIDFSPNTVAGDLGGPYPLALRAELGQFARRFLFQQPDPTGAAEFTYFQDPAIEGQFFGQWIVFDANTTPITTTPASTNISKF